MVRPKRRYPFRFTVTQADYYVHSARMLRLILLPR